MTIDLAATIDAMKASGMTSDEIVRALACVQAVDGVTSTRTPRQDRNRRYYLKASEKRLKASEQDVSDGDVVSPKEKSPTPPKEITPSDIPPATPKGVSAPKPTPRSELASVLSPLQADAVIAHRQRIGKPMTAHGAHLLAGKFAQCPDPNAAADAMVANGWQGFEPAWLERGGNQRAGPGKLTPIDHFRNYASEISNGQIRDDRGDGSDRDDAPGVPVRTIEHHG